MTNFYRSWYASDGALKVVLVTHSGLDVIDAPMNPWCYTKGKKYPTFDGKKADRVEFKLPNEIYGYKIKHETWEADVPYIKNVMRSLDWKIGMDFRKGYYDIECDDSHGFPDAAVNPIVSIALNDDFIHGDEKSILKEFSEKSMKYQMLCDYNGINFDRPYLKQRFYRNKMSNEWDMIERRTSFMDILDWYRLAGIYDKEIKRPMYNLDYIGQVEFGEGKTVKKRVFQMKTTELREYNLHDAEITKRLDEKYKLTDQRIQLAQLTYNFPDETTPLRMVDGLLLRKAYQKGLALPNKKPYDNSNEKSIKGAFILEPKAGVHTNVAVFDTKQMYPNIMKQLGLLLVSEIIEEMMKLRAYYKDEWIRSGETDSTMFLMQMAYKILSNIFYGAYINPANRIYNPNVGSQITAKGRAIVNRIIRLVDASGFEPMYADTDSCFVKCEPDEVERLKTFINKSIAPYEVSKAAYYTKLLFYSGAAGEGVKKRYAGYDEKGVMDVVGLEYVRMDRCEFVREFQKKIIEKILNGASKSEIEAFAEGEKVKLYKREYDNKLVVHKSVRDDYKVNTPQSRALKKLIARGERTIASRIGFVWTTDDVEPVLNDAVPSNIDRRRYWEEARGVVDRLITVYSKDTKLSDFNG